jgi:acyl carrier protein
MTVPTTITREQVQDKVFEVLATFGPEPEDISMDATFEALDVDSLDLAELSQIVEDEFGVGLKSADAKAIKTVGDAVDLIASRL